MPTVLPMGHTPHGDPGHTLQAGVGAPALSEADGSAEAWPLAAGGASAVGEVAAGFLVAPGFKWSEGGRSRQF
jgi:hypothetical protein